VSFLLARLPRPVAGLGKLLQKERGMFIVRAWEAALLSSVNQLLPKSRWEGF